MPPQVVLQVGLQLDPAAVAAIKAQLGAMSSGMAGTGAGPGMTSSQQFKVNLAQMYQQGREALSAQNANQAASIASQKAAYAQQLADAKAANTLKIQTARQLGSQQLAETRAQAAKDLMALRFDNQQKIIAIRQQAQDEARARRDAARQNDPTVRDFKAYVASQKFYGAANLLNTLGLPGGGTVSNVGNIVQFAGGKIGIPAAAGLGLAVSAIGAGVQFSKESVDKYKGVQTPIALLRALTGADISQAREFQQQGRQLSFQTGLSQEELARASYFISSSGFAGRSGQQVLNASALASQAGLGDVQGFADLLTSSLNAYQEQASQAIKYTDMFTATVREGKAEPDQLAKSLGQVLPVAAAAGVRMEEVGAAIATITKTGSSSPQAVTQLKQAIVSLIDPSKEARSALKSIGITANDIPNRIREEGFGAVLKDINDRAAAAGNRETILSTIFGNIRGFTGVLSLARGEFEEYERILGGIRNSQGDTARAAEIMGGTLEAQASRITAAFDGIQITLGEKIAASTQGAASVVEAMLLRINSALGGDIGDAAKARLFNLQQGTAASGEASGRMGFGNPGSMIQGGTLFNFITGRLNNALAGVTTTNAGFPMYSPENIPSSKLFDVQKQAEAELARVQKYLDSEMLPGMDFINNADKFKLTEYINQIKTQQIPRFGTALPGGGGKVRDQYENPVFAPPEQQVSSIYGKPLEPKDLAERNKTIIQVATGQVGDVLKTQKSFADAFEGAGDAFKTKEKLDKLKDAQVSYSYTVVNGKRVENAETVKSMALADAYKDKTTALEKAQNNLNRALNAKKPNPYTIANARLTVEGAERNLNLFNAQKPTGAEVAKAYNDDGTPIVGPDGKPVTPTVVRGTRRRGLSKKEQKELDDANAKIEAFNGFIDESVQNRALGGFETALNVLATTAKDGVAPGLADASKSLEQYLGATGKAHTATYTLGLAFQMLDNQLAKGPGNGGISFDQYLAKLKGLQDGIKGLAPQLTGAAPLTIEQAVEFKLVPARTAQLASLPDQVKGGLKQIRKDLGGGVAMEVNSAVQSKLNFEKNAANMGPQEILNNFLKAQGIDVSKGLEMTVNASLSAAGVDPKEINASIEKARNDVLKKGEEPLDPKPPVTIGAGAMTDSLSGPINSQIDSIVSGIKPRTVFVPVTLVTTVDGSGVPTDGTGGGSGTGGKGKSKGTGGKPPDERAKGGRVTRGRATLVGDGGMPELFIPDSDGYIVQGGTTNQILSQLYALGYSVDGRSQEEFLAPPATVAQVKEMAKMYPASELYKWVAKNQGSDVGFIHPDIGPQLSEQKIRELGQQKGTAANVYLSEKAKLDMLTAQRDSATIFRSGMTELNDAIEKAKLNARSARQAASSQYFDVSTGRRQAYGMNGIQSMSSLTAQSTADVMAERQRKENELRFKAIQNTTQAIINHASQVLTDAMSSSIVTGAGGGTSRVYRPADPVPRGTRRPGSGPVQQFAAGGFYRAGTLARVGELGAELFMSDQDGMFVNAANASRMNSIAGSGRFLDNAPRGNSVTNDYSQSFVIDARYSSNPSKVREQARRGVSEGMRIAQEKRRLRAIGRA